MTAAHTRRTQRVWRRGRSGADRGRRVLLRLRRRRRHRARRASMRAARRKRSTRPSNARHTRPRVASTRRRISCRCVPVASMTATSRGTRPHARRIRPTSAARTRRTPRIWPPSHRRFGCSWVFRRPVHRSAVRVHRPRPRRRPARALRA